MFWKCGYPGLNAAQKNKDPVIITQSAKASQRPTFVNNCSMSFVCNKYYKIVCSSFTVRLSLTLSSYYLPQRTQFSKHAIKYVMSLWYYPPFCFKVWFPHFTPRYVLTSGINRVHPLRIECLTTYLHGRL